MYEFYVTSREEARHAEIMAALAKIDAGTRHLVALVRAIWTVCCLLCIVAAFLVLS